MDEPIRSDQFLTIPRAAALLGTSARILRDARDRGELPVYAIGKRWERVSLADLRAWIETRRVGASRECEGGS